MKIWDNAKSIPEPYRFIAILWLSFLISIPPTGVFFSIFHPQELLAGAGLPSMSDTAVYTIGFFLLWIFAAASSLLTTYFLCDGDTTGVE